jgi:LmbE family N-acetylglucosaminyl deacetylase
MQTGEDMPDDALDFLVVSAHPDDAEVQMGGTVAKLARKGMRGMFLDLCDGEPSDFDAPEVGFGFAYLAMGASARRPAWTNRAPVGTEATRLTNAVTT